MKWKKNKNIGLFKWILTQWLSTKNEVIDHQKQIDCRSINSGPLAVIRLQWLF